MTPSVLETIIRRANEKQITNSKDVRKLRYILKDPLAREQFMSANGTVQSALEKVPLTPRKKRGGLLGDLEELTDALRRYPWTELAAIKGDPRVLQKLDETDKLLKDLKKTLSG